MAFDNNYPNRKDRRAPYYKTGRWIRSCRNHGSCDWCKSNRTHKNVKREPIVEDDFVDIVKV